MARFRTNFHYVGDAEAVPDTVNLAGGEAFSQSPELELILLLTTTLLKDDFYRSANATADRLKTLVKEVGPEYAAQAAILARHEFGIRSATHLIAGELSHQIKGQPWAANFYRRVCRRPDDALEILGYIWANFKQYPGAIPSRVKRGLGAYLSGLNEYALAKYRGSTSALKMIDAVNLLRPKHSEPIGKIVRDNLPAPVTWEVELTRAGKSGGEITEAAVWRKLLMERKLGYMALLRNIRNIIQADRTLVSLLHSALVNREAIKKALVFPYRFEVALKTVKNDLGEFNAESRFILEALDEAVEYSLDNVPVFEGKTLVAVDESGSMQSNKVNTLAGLFGIALARANNGDLISFDTSYRTHAYRRGVTVLATLESIRWHGGGTDFHQIFHYARGSGVAYDRIVILSDMQSWVSYHTPAQLYHLYCNQIGKRVKIFTFDLVNYGSLQFPEKDVYALAGFNADAVFKIMGMLEQDPRAIVNRVKAVDLLAKSPSHTFTGTTASEEESAAIPT